MNPFNRRSVTGGVDFDRILRLPTRGPFDAEQLAVEMTEALKMPGGTMKLRPIQAQALYELMAHGGLLAPMGVGTGKTLVFLMASVVLGLRRPIGLLPASLLDKTERERRELLKHWRVDKSLQLYSYEMLGRESSAKWLDLKQPDGIITDESHRLKNTKAACTRRVKRWMQEHPTTKFVAMSGTLTKNSIRDFAHLARWSLSPTKAPVPMQEGELGEWADALDERVQPLKRVRPGVLVRLAKPSDIVEDDDTATARRAFHRRLVETPGVVCSLNAEQVDCSLRIEGKILSANKATEDNFQTLRELWETPDGWALAEAVDVWRHARELALGFHYVRVDARKYKEWRAKTPRSVANKLRRIEQETLSDSGQAIESEARSGVPSRKSTTCSCAATGLGSTNTRPFAPNTTANAISAARSKSASALITTTSQGPCEVCSASLAIEQSESSETMPSEWQEQLNTFLASARPPEHWLEKRRAWAKFVRDTLAKSRTLDTEKQVRNAVLGGDLPEGARTWAEWQEVTKDFEPYTFAVWHDTAALDYCQEWMSDNPGIVWTEHTFFGHELSRRTGWPYFGQNGLDVKGNSILDAQGPIIASIAANGTGKNLQRYGANLVTSCPTGASIWEQLLGRTHRPGQTRDEVTAEVLLGCVEHVEAWARAEAEARMASDMFGQPQKILFSDVLNMPKATDVRAMPGHRWRKTASQGKGGDE